MQASRLLCAASAPGLRARVKEVARLIHPDRFARTPRIAEENSKSLAALQSLADIVERTRDGHPPARVSRLLFHVHAPPGGAGSKGAKSKRGRGGKEGLVRVEHVLKTTGGDCRHVVQRSLSELFAKLGIERDFTWGEGAWQILSEEEQAERNAPASSSSPEQTPETVESPPSAPPPPPPPSPPPQSSQAHDEGAGPPPISESIQRMDPALQLLAAVPWLGARTDEESRDRVKLAMQSLDHLERNGWRLREGAELIWAGGDASESSEALLSALSHATLDEGSREALKQLLFHTKQLEREHGTAPK
mmetsp:Transcript_13139/g.43284  ORF Transcript_13139/g.43284 Transcript_13139/m.43284 type:complete len:305 (+) Transcript_13139:50-964(+)